MSVEEQVLRKVGRYEIVAEVGRGATAVVYLARQTDLDRNVALKELAAFHASDQAFIRRFLRESRLAGSLNHPNIVTVHEYFEHEGTPFIAMEYLERGSLRPLTTTVTLPQFAGVLEGLLAGLAHAETRGIVHRDLKPENVLVTSNGGVKIADFGLAKALQVESAPLTLTDTTVGTPAYMAPEQATAGRVGPWADLYAVGVLAYEMLAGEVPFHGSDVAMAILLQHLNEQVPPLRSIKPELDPQLCDWVERMLAKNPQDRPRGAAAAWDELEEIVIRLLGPRWIRQSRLTGSGPVAAATLGRSATAATEKLPPSRRTGRRLPRAVAVGMIALLALIGATGAVAVARLVGSSSGKAAAPPHTSTGQTTRPTTPKSPPRPILTRVDVADHSETVTGALRLVGGTLARGGIVVRDADLSDGRASFLLRGKGIGSRTRGGDYGPIAIRIRKGAGHLLVNVRARSGAFSVSRVRRVDGHTVSLTLTRPSSSGEATPTVTGTTTTPGTATPPTDTTTTTTTTRPKKKTPEIQTG